MPVDATLPYQYVSSSMRMRKILFTCREPFQTILLDRLDKHLIGVTLRSGVPGMRMKVVGYRWYEKGFGESGKNPTMWPVMQWEAVLE